MGIELYIQQTTTSVKQYNWTKVYKEQPTIPREPVCRY